ncbi:glycerophosphodiester phosphodiesterase [Nocardioides zhouii]|nr:glycerophosphodiester phosphodiesterase family protein [Nocardioides zhouii]
MLLVAHRGASAVAPENTLSAFRAAIEAGADAIEFDVQASADGQLVVVHDSTLDRTTDGTGAVFETDGATIAGLDAGGWFSPGFAGERVPTLEEVLALDGVGFELELKGYGVAFLEAVLHAVRAAHALDRVEFTGWNLPLLARLKRLEPSARTGLFSSRQPEWMPDPVFEHHVVGTAATSGFDVAHVYAGDLTPSISQRLHGLGLEVHANDAASAEDVRRAMRSGADRLSANDVDLALQVMRPS